jgi:phage protein U
MATPFALFGDVRLELPAWFTGLVTRTAVDYAEHALATGKPLLQRMGDKLAEVDCEAAFHVHFCNPDQEILKLLDMAKLAKAQPLSMANGEFAGYFVVTEITQTRRATFADGTAFDVAVSFKLREFCAPDRAAEFGLATPVVEEVGEAVVEDNVPIEEIGEEAEAAAEDVLGGLQETAQAFLAEASAAVSSLVAAVPLPTLPNIGLPTLPNVPGLPAQARQVVAALRNPAIPAIRLGNFDMQANVVIGATGVTATASLALPGTSIGTRVEARL